MRSMSRFFLVVLWVLLGSCSEGALPSLQVWAGHPEKDGYRYAQEGEVQDGLTPVARFRRIWDIAIDDLGYVYVLDEVSNPRKYFPAYMLLRRVSPDGEVMTIAGQHPSVNESIPYPEPILSHSTLEIAQNKLYFSSAGCLIQVELKPILKKTDFKILLGQCLTAEEQKNVDFEKNPNPLYLEVRHIIANTKGDVLVLINKSMSLLFNDDKKTDEIDLRGLPVFDVIDNDLNGYYWTPGLADPFGGAPSGFDKRKLTGEYLPELGREKLTSPSKPFALDAQDRLYLLDAGFIKRIDGQGDIVNIANVGGEKTFDFQSMAIHPATDMVFLADQTAVYKVEHVQ